MKKLIDAEILSNREIKKGIFDMRLKAPEIAEQALPGQFVNIYLDSPRSILPRPFSICRAEDGAMRIVYKVAGEGTALIARKREGGILRACGPLGNGFRLPRGNRALLAGGGVGAPPLLFLAERLRKERPDAVIRAALGFRTESQMILETEFDKFCDLVVVSTDDGSHGENGFIVETIARMGITADEICACGPKPMLRAAAAYAGERELPCQVSLEERMACGIGACLGCAVKAQSGARELADSVEAGKHAASGDATPFYRRVCADGPVFDAGEVAWDE